MSKILALTILTILYPMIPGIVSKTIYYGPEPITPSFSDWHWPLPAGEWKIDRGSCKSPLAINHGCDYYEDKCAIGLTTITSSDDFIPVLAPVDGIVVYVGNRPYTGIEVMLEHSDGRVSALYHLSKAVVEADQSIEQGEVIGYFGHTGSSKSKLHFHVQPNIVSRECLEITGLDEINYQAGTITSYNTSKDQLIFVNPPQPLLDGLPPVVVSNVATYEPTRLTISENQQALVLVQLTGVLSDTTILRGKGVSTIITTTVDRPTFKVLFESYDSLTGHFSQRIYPNSANSKELSFALNYTIEPFINMNPSSGTILPNPKYVSPISFSRWDVTPELCWKYPEILNNQKLKFRVYISGPDSLESFWSDDHCSQLPELPAGIYYWKVVVKDDLGNLNPPNQWPSAFIIRE